MKYVHQSITTLVATVISLSAQAMERSEPAHDYPPFTDVDLEQIVPKKFTPEISGFEILPYKDTPNRNHYDDLNNGSLTKMDGIMMHYTVCNATDTIRLFTKDAPSNRVSAHFIITQREDGTPLHGGEVLQVVPLDKRAWHAGISAWREFKNLNGSFFGIENVNPGFTPPEGQPETWYPFDEKQIESLGLLSRALIDRHHIAPYNIVGHADVAPKRKHDPGILFPWATLYYKYGVGAWIQEDAIESPSLIEQQWNPQEPLPQGVNIAFLSKYLRAYGYSIEETAYPNEDFNYALRAFKAHFSRNQHPEHYTFDAGREEMIWAWALVARYAL
jgi:N-acetylmuramoyl-L-alanine amidase